MVTVENLTEATSWFAIWTRSNHESLAVTHLAERGIKAFLPTLDVPSVRRDRRVTLHRPLFPGYFFVRSDLPRAERIAILKTPGVVQILGSKIGPQTVPDWQIRSVRIALETHHPVEVFYHLVPGKRVTVLDGPLAGVEGVILSGPANDGHAGGDRIVVSIDILGRSVAIKLPCAQVKAA